MPKFKPTAPAKVPRTRRGNPMALAAMALASMLAVTANAEPARKTYIVQMKDEPAITYTGGIQGLAATAPASGKAYSAQRAEVGSYVNYLHSAVDSVTRTIGNVPVLAKYDTVFNGFAARLSDAEVRILSSNTQVAGIWEDRARKLDTISTANFLRLATPGGLWSQTVNGAAVKGENLVIGVIDGGIWPENPAFFDRVDGNGVPSSSPADKLAYGPAPASFKGICQAGEGFSSTQCNNKLIGARYFKSGFDAFSQASGQALHWTDFVSPRDSLGGQTGHGGHGDHTASTAAGNSGVSAILNGFAVGTATGMAPRARVAAYKVCWTYVDPTPVNGTGSLNSCFDSDMVAAIDTAVKDGVNAINFSISGSQTSVNDAVEQAFYRAALGGVFVAAAAGNDGPDNGTVAHLSPWLTTVAASNHDRGRMYGQVILGNGDVYDGGTTNQVPLPAAPLINADDAGMNGGIGSLCFSDPTAAAAMNLNMTLLDPAKVKGKIVICSRGINDRRDKGDAVFKAGGIGMILTNGSGGLSIDNDQQAVPTVQVDNIPGAMIRAYAKTAGAKASLSAAMRATVTAPIVANFSSRGPNGADANVLKPDLAAPGVDIIAQVTPALSADAKAGIVNGTLVPPPAWDSYDGTSMATPHVAGSALLLKQVHPDWGPAAIKSALMTTAYPTLDDGLSGMMWGGFAWGQGAGEIDPTRAADPGLIYDSGKSDWIKYQCKVNKAAIAPASDCGTVGTFGETYELNLPSIAAGATMNTVTIPRTVTNVGKTTATYTAGGGMGGYSLEVIPSVLTLAPGASASFVVKLTPTFAVEGQWNYGGLVWSDGEHQVVSPIVARVGPQVQLQATDITGTTSSGSKLFSIRTAFAGKLQTRVGGMKDVTVSPEVSLKPTPLSAGELKSACLYGSSADSVKVYPFEVPAGTVIARFALRSADVGDPDDDHDLLVLYPDHETTGYSNGPGSDEAVQILSPAPGTYRVCVNAFEGKAQMKHKLSSWIVGPGDGAGLKLLAPSTVYASGTATVGLSWSGLATGGRYVGGVQYLDNAGQVAATSAVRISTDGTVQMLGDQTSVVSKVAPRPSTK